MAELLDFPGLLKAQASTPSISRLAAEKMENMLLAPPVVIGGTLDPYIGDWNEHTAKHLLQRAMFAPNAEQIAQAVNDGLEVTISKLFSPVPEPELPINYDFQNDPNVPIGQSWVYTPIIQATNYSHRSMRAWQVGLVLNEGVSLQEKMVLFWHNHFVTADANHAKLIYQYADLLRKNAFGNFRHLVKEITVNSLMLQYLNGNENNKNAPNENYARELLELFTIGKGVQAGPGDYTNYTETDIKEIARALTGWTIDFAKFQVAGPHPPAIFRINRHDTGTKTLSNRFNNAVINNLGAEEYKAVVDIILEQEEVSRYMARKLYRWFVYYHIDAEIEANVIEPLATLMRQENYEMQPVITALLSSQHFYNENAVGCMIKSPIDFTASVIKTFEVTLDFNQNQTYTMWFLLHGLNATMQQDMFTPPSVAGWKAYYQDPIYYRNWINSVTLTVRRAVTDGMAVGQINVFDRPWGIDVLKVVGKIPNATDPNVMIAALVNLALPWPLTQAQLDYLKEILIPGLPDFEWTVEYGAYLLDPTNEALRMAVENRLRALFLALMGLPEFQLQ
jgi:uncharacterized protein (DUF1800 family)